MLLILSPSKTMNKCHERLNVNERVPFPELTDIVLHQMRQYAIEDLMSIMKISETLAIQTSAQYENFECEWAQPAILAYDGEVYRGLNASSFSDKTLQVANTRLFILSALYGMSSALTPVRLYRLEMGLKLAVTEGESLVKFWKPHLTQALMDCLEAHDQEKTLLNLASLEYSKAIDLRAIHKKYRVVSVAFKEKKGESYKVIGMYAKRARGTLARYILENEIDEVSRLKAYNEEGYVFNESLSTDDLYVFTR